MSKKPRRGLIIGKFYPFHNGHKYLIDIGLKNSKELTVIVCQTERYKIPAEIRADWIRQTFPGLDVRILHHEPSMDSDSTNVSEAWAKLTIDFLEYAPDIVFTSENYGEPYAKFMGSRHILVDLKRTRVPISATEIRFDLDKHWKYLPASTKSYFFRKIVVLGAESTGTTTLAMDLAKHFHTVWVPEYGRLYYEGKMFSAYSSVWTTDEFTHIADMQNKIEESLATEAGRLLVCDTDAFATTVWYERYMGREDKYVDKQIKKEKPALYIVTDIDIPFVQDGTRDGEKIRTWMHHRFLEKLNIAGANYIVVSGSKKKRLKDAVQKIKQTLPLWT